MLTALKGEQPIVPIKRVAQQVDTSIKISCGCGYVASNVPDAERHAKSERHTLTVHGIIRAS